MCCHIKITHRRGCIHFEDLTKNFKPISTLRIAVPSTNKTIIWKSFCWWILLNICNIGIDLKFLTSFNSIIIKHLSTYYIFISIPTLITSHNYKPTTFKGCNFWLFLTVGYIRIYSKFWSLLTSIMSKYLAINSLFRSILKITCSNNNKTFIW